MLSRECFVTALQAIREQDAVLDEARKVLQKLSDFPVSLDYLDGLNRKAFLKVLTEVMRDKNEWILWWLYEDVEKVVTWEENGKQFKADLTDVNDLYDFLVKEVRDAKAEQLPLRDYDGEVLFPEYSHRVMELDDFQVYFESILRHVNQYGIILHINDGEEEKYVLMPIKCYERMMGCAVSDEEGQSGAEPGDCGN